MPLLVKLIDLSQPLGPLSPSFPGDAAPQSTILSDHDTGGFRVESLRVTSRSGTHIDTPLHRIKGGAGLEQWPLNSFVGKAVLADLRDSRPGQPFTSTWLTRRLRTELEDRIVLLVTGWGQKRAATEEWVTQGPYVSPDAAEWLIEQNVRGVGIDHISIGGTRPEQNSLTHQLLLEAGIWIVEDLLLPDELFSLPQPMDYWGLPIHVLGATGALCRPVIVTEG